MGGEVVSFPARRPAPGNLRDTAFPCDADQIAKVLNSLSRSAAVPNNARLYRTGIICLCGSTHWLVGRHSAECAHCATALPLAPVVEVRRG